MPDRSRNTCGRAAGYGERVDSDPQRDETSVRGSLRRAILGLSLGVLLGVVGVAALMTTLVVLVLWYLNSHGT